MGKEFGDAGYMFAALKSRLLEKGMDFITQVKKNRKKPNWNDFDKALLGQRAMVESVINQLKNIRQIEHAVSGKASPASIHHNLASKEKRFLKRSR